MTYKSRIHLHKYLFVNGLKKTVHTIDSGDFLSKSGKNSICLLFRFSRFVLYKVSKK